MQIFFILYSLCPGNFLSHCHLERRCNYSEENVVVDTFLRRLPLHQESRDLKLLSQIRMHFSTILLKVPACTKFSD